MKQREDKELDALIRHMLKQTERKSPSDDFTRRVMAEVEQLAAVKKQRSTPLIPKFFWIILSACYIIILVFIFKNDVLNADGWFSKIGRYSNSLFDYELPGLQLSGTLVYGALCATTMVLVQVLVLRRRV